ncbi:MAG TPA: helix-turn-helix transcriptional regulator [Micromonosporaceae bacterium]|nr:helix-turn-helix transcriptional regulator [Micromonosporaceae bacterium]
MAVGSPPTVRRRQLGRELRRLREDAGLHLDQMAEQLRCSPSRLSRIETARIRITPGTVHEILDALDIHDDRRDRLVTLARQAEEPNWWQEYTDVLPYEYATFIALEAEAASLRVFEPMVVYGLLQTEDYAREVVRFGRRFPADEVEARVAARMARQAVLTRAEPVDLHVILDEATLIRTVGGPAVMRGQMRRLLDLAELPKVHIQVLPATAAGTVMNLTGPFVVIDLAGSDDPPIVYLEILAGDVYVERASIVQMYDSIFQSLCAEALDEKRSMDMIAQLARNL